MDSFVEKLTEPIRDKQLPIGYRLNYAAREMAMTKGANEELRKRGDSQGVRWGEEYLRTLERLIDELGAAERGRQ
jgi:hypothetical protein